MNPLGRISPNAARSSARIAIRLRMNQSSWLSVVLIVACHGLDGVPEEEMK